MNLDMGKEILYERARNCNSLSVADREFLCITDILSDIKADAAKMETEDIPYSSQNNKEHIRLYYNELIALDGEEYINNLYHTVLHRDPDAEGFSFFNRSLEARLMTKEHVIAAFCFSDEALKNDVEMVGASAKRINVRLLLRLEGEEFIRRSYEWLLGRAPFSAELSEHLRALSAGAYREQVLHGLVCTEEYKKRQMRVVGLTWKHIIASIKWRLKRFAFVRRVLNWHYTRKSYNNKALLTEIEELKRKLEVSEMCMSNANMLYSRLEQNYHKLSEETNKTRASVDEAFQRIEESENTIRDSNSVFDTVQKENGELKTDVVHIINDIVNLNDDIGDITNDVLKLKDSMDTIKSNLHGNNVLIANMAKSLDLYQEDKELLKNISIELSRLIASYNAGELSTVKSDTDKYNGDSAVPEEDTYSAIDYFDFENHFRGSREHVKKVQEIYLPYFLGRKNVLDLGCGRGEFTELLTDNGIGVTGVDLYEPYVGYGKLHNLPVVVGDAVEYLQKQESVDGIFLGQVVEHISISKVIEICKLAYEKLESGSYLIMETPNPMSLAIFTECFYIDPSHKRPVHPRTLQYLVEKAGFSEVQILFTDSSRMPFSIPKLHPENPEEYAEFNEAMGRVENLLYGSQDYAVIAKKG